MGRICCYEKIRLLRKNSWKHYCLGSVKVQASKNRSFCTDFLADDKEIFCLLYTMNKVLININFRQLLYVILCRNVQIFKSV
jgi:hypothetical protein